MKTTSSQTLPRDRHAYAWLGRMVMALEPDVAKTILATYYAEDQRPHDTNLSNIEDYFEHFCTLRALDKTNQIGNFLYYEKGRSDERNLFIAAMASLYRPAYFRTCTAALPIKDHLPSAIARVLHIHRAQVSRKMQQVVFWQQELEDFRIEVETIVTQLKTFNP